MKEINNYYKMIIDNLYSSYCFEENDSRDKEGGKNKNEKDDLKFPWCLELDVEKLTDMQKLKIISLFYYDAYRLLDTYEFKDLNKFFEAYLNKQKTKNKRLSSRIIVHKSLKQKFFLPPINPSYKFTLVLDLDETLIYYTKKTQIDKKNIHKEDLIFRPGLIDFLKKMKQLYELVLFSFGVAEYVEEVLSLIEKKEKFFDHILTRGFATFNGGDFVKNLELLGRDLRNVCIVDDIPQMYKLQKSNGICIKAFYGDTVGDRNTLKKLGKLLEKIRFDAEDCGDIRISIRKFWNEIFKNITTDF